MSNSNGNGNESAKEAVKPTLSASDKKKLFEAYEAAESKVKAAESAVEKALDARSASVKAILDAMGSGPKGWHGRVLTPVKAPRGERYVMRGESKAEVDHIG